MIERKSELIAKLDEMDARKGLAEVASDITINVLVSGLDKISDKFPPSAQEALNALVDGLIDGEFDKAETKDGGETPPDPDPDK